MSRLLMLIALWFVITPAMAQKVKEPSEVVVTNTVDVNVVSDQTANGSNSIPANSDTLISIQCISSGINLTTEVSPF